MSTVGNLVEVLLHAVAQVAGVQVISADFVGNQHAMQVRCMGMASAAK